MSEVEMHVLSAMVHEGVPLESRVAPALSMTLHILAPVVLSPHLVIRKDLVSSTDLLELLLCFIPLVRRHFVRVELQCLVAVGLFDLFRGRCARDAQNFIVVHFLR